MGRAQSIFLSVCISWCSGSKHLYRVRGAGPRRLLRAAQRYATFVALLSDVTPDDLNRPCYGFAEAWMAVVTLERSDPRLTPAIVQGLLEKAGARFSVEALRSYAVGEALLPALLESAKDALRSVVESVNVTPPARARL